MGAQEGVLAVGFQGLVRTGGQRRCRLWRSRRRRASERKRLHRPSRPASPRPTTRHARLRQISGPPLLRGENSRSKHHFPLCEPLGASVPLCRVPPRPSPDLGLLSRRGGLVGVRFVDGTGWIGLLGHRSAQRLRGTEGFTEGGCCRSQAGFQHGAAEDRRSDGGPTRTGSSRSEVPSG